MATQLFIIIPYYHVHTSQCSNINRYVVWCISSYLEARVVWLFSLEEKMRKRIMSHKVSILVLFLLLLLCYFVVVGSFLSKIKFMLFLFYEPRRIVFVLFFLEPEHTYATSSFLSFLAALFILCAPTLNVTEVRYKNTNYLNCFMRNAWDIILTLW